MVVLLSTILTCTEAWSLVNRITKVVGLKPEQKVEIISEIRKVVPTCPVKIQKDVTK